MIFLNITKTCLYNFDPLKPHFYIVNLGFTGVYIIFLILLKNTDCGYSLELPCWGGSNKYSQSMFWAKIWKISEFFIWKNSFFLVVNFQYIWIGVFSQWICLLNASLDLVVPLPIYDKRISWIDCADALVDPGLCCSNNAYGYFIHTTHQLDTLGRFSIIFTRKTTWMTSCLLPCTPSPFWNEMCLL